MHEFGLERCYFENHEITATLKIRKRQNISVCNVKYVEMLFKLCLFIRVFSHFPRRFLWWVEISGREPGKLRVENDP
jgi:hypothetical protein